MCRQAWLDQVHGCSAFGHPGSSCASVQPDGACLLYVDRHIVHEVDSPQAFAGLRRSGLPSKRRKKPFWSSTTMCRHRIAAGRTRIP